MTVSFETANVTKRFGSVTAVDGVSIAVAAGEVVGLIGANGAGKTTLIKLLLGLLAPTAGHVRVLGRVPDRRVRTRMGYMPQGLGLYPDLTVEENVEFAAAAFGTEPDLDDVLREFADVSVQDLSLGVRRRVAFRCALGHRPDVLILDEPTSGVDPLGRADLWDTIHAAADAGAAVLVSTHYMDEAEQCDRLVVMAGGRQVASGAEGDIIGQLTSVKVEPADRSAWEALAAAHMVAVPLAGGIRVAATNPAMVREVVGVGHSVESIPATLEDAFVALSRSG